MSVRSMLARTVAFAYGFADGWSQPWELSTSRSVQYLATDEVSYLDLMEALDHGVNLGQSLRGGHRSQADREGFVPWGLRRRLAGCVALLGTAWPVGHGVAQGVANGATMVAVSVAIVALWVIFTGARSSYRTLG